jgi:hypothetical protein
MKEFDLEEIFTRKPEKAKSISDVEDMRLFFQERHISNKVIGLMDANPPRLNEK